MNGHDIAVLYRAYGYVVFRRCLAYLADVGAARAVMQQTFVRALRDRCSFHAYGDPQVWLCRVADEICVSILHSNARNAIPRPELSPGQLRASVADDDHDRLLKVLPLLHALPPGEARFAVLFCLDELTEDELAQELGLSRRAVARRITQLLRSAPLHALESSPC